MKHWLLSLIASPTMCLGTISAQNGDYYDSKTVLVLGGGVTGTWAAAKIAEGLKENDELMIVTPP